MSVAYDTDRMLKELKALGVRVQYPTYNNILELFNLYIGHNTWEEVNKIADIVYAVRKSRNQIWTPVYKRNRA